MAAFKAAIFYGIIESKKLGYGRQLAYYMELKDVTKNLRDQTSYRLEQRFKEMMRTNPRYRNLDKENQKLILDLISRERRKAAQGIKTSGYTIREELYHLYQNRVKLGLTYNDLDQIKELLESFKD